MLKSKSTSNGNPDRTKHFLSTNKETGVSSSIKSIPVINVINSTGESCKNCLGGDRENGGVRCQSNLALMGILNGENHPACENFDPR